MKKILRTLGELIILAFALGTFFLSLYKVAQYVRLNINFSFPGASAIFFGTPPPPPCPPPCPSQCPTSSPTPPPSLTPSPSPTPTPTPPPEEPTPPPASPTPTLSPTPTPPPAGNGGVGGPPGAPICGASTPDAPHLKRATSIGGSQVELEWDPVSKATHYTVSYGPSPGNYLWGVPNTGNVTSTIIGDISGGCFVVRAVNDCAPSDPSNEFCTGQIAPQVLGLSTTGGSGGINPVTFWFGLMAFIFGLRLVVNAKN